MLLSTQVWIEVVCDDLLDYPCPKKVKFCETFNSELHRNKIGVYFDLIFFFHNLLCARLIINKKENKLKKGSGFHLDLFILGGLACFNGLFGLPWVWAATVRSVTHVGALSIFSKSNAPGEKPHLEGIREQRVTAFLVNVMIGL